jgi:hypothetical protein
MALFFSASPKSFAQDPNRQLNRDQAPPAQRSADRRIALVIGNGAYTSAPPLKNPPNDARDMAATLKTLGFDVTSGINVNQREIKRLIREFGQKLKGGEALRFALFQSLFRLKHYKVRSPRALPWSKWFLTGPSIFILS